MINAAEREGAENAIDMVSGRLVALEEDVKEGISAFKEKRAPRY
jgi:enoyl-CoA hydratase/carnithine racemase